MTGALGLDKALQRGEAYVKAGADVLLIESSESEMEMARIARSFDVPLVANMVEGGRTPLLSARQLKELGFRMAIYRVAVLLVAAAALRRVCRRLRGKRTRIHRHAGLSLNELMGFEEVWEFERRHAEYPRGGAS